MKLTCYLAGIILVFLAIATGAQDVTPPLATQTIIQPSSAQSGHMHPSSWDWSYTDRNGSLGDLTSPGPGKSLTLPCSTSSPCPVGIDTSAKNYLYKIYIVGSGTSEAALVTGGTCTPRATSSCTLIVSTVNAHRNGYTIRSASSGIQEAWNDAWVNDDGAAPNASSQAGPYVKLQTDTLYNVYAAVYLRGRGGILDGAGALIVCSTRDRCIYVGVPSGPYLLNHHKLYNLSFTTPVLVEGANVAHVCAGASCTPAQSNGTYVITTAANHPFIAGDTVDCEYYSQKAQQHWMSRVASVPSSTSFTVSFGKNSFATSPATFGFCNIENAAIEVNSDHTIIQDLNIFVSNPVGMGAFNYGVVNDNDQQLIIERAANRSSSSINPSGTHTTATWPIGAFVYERNDQGNNGITYLHNSEFTNVNCFTAGGNGAVFSDSVCQGFPLYGMRYFGGYQPLTFSNVYEESTGSTPNPLYGSPAIAAQMGLLSQGGNGSKVSGVFPISGWTPMFVTGGGAGTQRNYFVVPRSSVFGYGPVLYIGSAQPTNSGVSIPLKWPMTQLRTAANQSVGTVTWDVLVSPGSGSVPIGTGNYSVVTNTSATCGPTGMCSFTDTQSATGSYTVQAAAPWPSFWFWPTNIAINSTTPLLMDSVATAPGIISTQGGTGVSVVADQCVSGGYATVRSPIWIQCLATSTAGGQGSVSTVLAQVDAANNGPAVNSKGRLNLGKPIAAPNDLLTLQDSNFTKTITTSGERPSNDAGDMAIGVDQGGGLTQRAMTSISSYINARPSGANYLERLTADLKYFAVPIQARPRRLSELPACSPRMEGMQAPVTDSTTRTWGATITGGGSNHVLAYCDGSAWTVAAI